MLIWLSESSLLGWFSEVSPIRDNQGKVTLRLSKGWIIREWKTDNQAFRHVSPYFSQSADDSPDQTVDRTKIECHLILLYTTHPPGLPAEEFVLIFWVPSRVKSDGAEEQRGRWLWTRRPWKVHWKHESIPCPQFVMTKESSPTMMTHTGNASSLRWQEVGRSQQGAEEVVAT